VRLVSVLAALALLALLGCSASTEETPRDHYEPGKIAYFKDGRTNLCFAVVSYSRFDAAGRIAYGLSHTAVPCSPQVEALVR
jgi:outer membrane biogenesis lipoprotein LolB